MSSERWIAAISPFVRSHLPRPPARVLELGCGALGGFVPMLRAGGYDATGVDPEAPAGPEYRRTTFEEAALPERADAVVAAASLHHVDDADAVVDRIVSLLPPGGTLVVVEWAWEEFDEATARWSFERLAPGAHGGWLEHHRERWLASGQAWDRYLSEWARREGLHAARALLEVLDRRFDRVLLERGPYVFADLAEVTEADERLAIERGEIRATRVDYVGRVPAS